MPSYTRTTKIDVDEDTAYAYLSKAENLPEYFPRITEVNKKSGDEVETTAVIEPPGEPEQKVHGTAWFKTDDDAHKVEWGSEGSNHYHGELDFDPNGDAASTLRLTLSTESDHPGIEESIDETLATISKKLTAGS
ncbi:MAG: SRPBCC family protein [Humibacillus sp.]|nr:SRPBCC family protein [Humibacillus sp.]MDN5779906.1 SRPBCC family protein [Humibacillus sp.]